MATPNPDQHKSPPPGASQQPDVRSLVEEWRAQAAATQAAKSAEMQARAEAEQAPAPTPEPNQARTEWWRYPLAIIAFVAIIILGSILFSLAYHLANYLSPRAFQNSEAWMYFASDVFAAYCACAAVGGIVKANHKFCYIFLLIAFVYFLFVAIWNYLLGTSLFYEAISTGACGIVCLIMAVQRIKADIKDGKGAPA